MIILDNSVLSALTKLELLDKLHIIFPKILIPESVIMEYQEKFHSRILNFVDIVRCTRSLEGYPQNMSNADVDVVELGLYTKMIIASDDLTIRKYAKSLNLKITGSLGILKRMYIKYLINGYDEYKKLVYRLSEGVYMTEQLIEWALNT